MASIDDLFKKPNQPSNKRKLEPSHDPSHFYKSAKLTANGDAKGKGHATIEDELDDEIEAGPALPPDNEEYGPEDDEEGRFFGGGVDQGTRDALDFIDERDKEDFVPEQIDAAWVRKLGLNFEKRISKNAELRAKYEDEPQKFMGSEADLDADIKALSILSEHPELYDEFARLGCVASLVSLLSHENTDIAIDALEILSELIDEDVQAEQAQWDALVSAALDADLLSLLAQNLERLDEANDADRSGVYHSLSILESLASSPDTAARIGSHGSIPRWLLARMRRKETPVSQNKQYAAELLAILLQSSPAARARLVAELDGVDALLQLLAPYRRRDPPKDTDEEEFVENVFDALACAVDDPAGKAAFATAEGVELALIMLREGKMSRPRALRLLDHAVGGEAAGAGREVCERVVEAAGLKTLFGMFMRKVDGATAEHLLGIFAALLRCLPGESAARIRVLAKFVERDYEKIGRVVELRREYAARVRAVEKQIRAEREEGGDGDRAEREAEWFSRRLDAGLFCLQTADVILAWLVAEDDGSRKRIVGMLAERDESLRNIKATLQEQVSGLDGVEMATEEERNLRDMLETLMGFLQ